MITLGIIIVALSIFEIAQMRKKKLKKEIVIYICLAIISFTLGAFYISKPLSKSISRYALDLLERNNQ
ncbi:MAG: hypothetical protein M0R40_06080 [Firmicutes bacterium]|nr:hypothetical protein [Bacillota bacterium]